MEPMKAPAPSSKTTWEVRFDSLGDFLDYVGTLPDQQGNANNRSQGSAIDKEREQFSGTASLPDALKLARNGWPKGRAQMVDGVRDAFRGRAAAGIGPGITYDVAGAVPCAPAAAAGDPMCMMDFQPEIRAARPIVRLLVPFVYSANVQHQTIINRGIAMLTLIDAIEAAGQRCEIDLIWVAGGDGSKDTATNVLRVCVKRPEEPLDLDRLAFAIAHPSFLRRIGFAFWDKTIGGDARIGWGYGFPNRLKGEAIPAGWNYLPGIDNQNTGPFSTIAGALAYLEPLMVAEPEVRMGEGSS